MTQTRSRGLLSALLPAVPSAPPSPAAAEPPRPAAARPQGWCPSRLALTMAGRLLGRLRTKDPAQLVHQAHQAFTRLPYEANPERVADELSKILHSMKVAAAPTPAYIHSAASRLAAAQPSAALCAPR